MYPTNIDKKTLISALAGAGICLFFQRSGFLTLFFLVPLGFLAFRCNYRTAWFALLFAVPGNALLTGFTALAMTGSFPPEAVWDILYFTCMAVIFTLINAPPPALAARFSGIVRFVIGSCLGALLFVGIYFRILATPEFSGYMTSLIDSLFAAYSSAGSDVVQNALLESINAETVLAAIKAVMLRGGSLISCVLLFFISRQIGLALARLVQRKKGTSSLTAFHVYPALIWVLSVSLLLVVLTGILKFEIPEIILWNILVLCAILYFAQGAGIIQFFLARPSTPPFLRFFFNVLFIVLIFSPGINAVLLGGVVLLGIAENWVSFRAPKSHGPPSTPEAGGNGN